jgi:hypothetical protein
MRILRLLTSWSPRTVHSSFHPWSRPSSRWNKASLYCQLVNLEKCESPHRRSLSPMVEGCNASIDHGLDSKALTDFHLSWHFRVSVVHDAWIVGVELDRTGACERADRFDGFQPTHELVDTVTDILSHNAETLGLDNRLDLVTDIPVESPGLYQCDGSLHRFLCRGDQSCAVLIDLSNGVGCVQVSMEAYTGGFSGLDKGSS